MMQRKLLVCVLNLVRIASLQLALQRNRGVLMSYYGRRAKSYAENDLGDRDDQEPDDVTQTVSCVLTLESQADSLRYILTST